MQRTFSSVHHEHVAGKHDASIVLNDLGVRSFRENGFAVLTDAFAADELAAEMDDVFADAFGIEAPQDGTGGIRFASVPMMSERKPTSSLLADALGVVCRVGAPGEPVAAEVLVVAVVGEQVPADHQDRVANSDGGFALPIRRASRQYWAAR